MNATHEPAPQMTRKALRYEINLATQEPQWVKRLVLGLSCVFFVLFILKRLLMSRQLRTNVILLISPSIIVI